MCNPATSPAWIDRLTLSTLDSDRQAAVAIASVPLPRTDHALVAFDGLRSQAVPIAWYPSGEGGEPDLPRQILVMGVADGAVPDDLGLVAAPAGAVVLPHPVAAPATQIPGWTGPTWRAAVVEEKKTGLMMREVNELVIEHAGRRLGLRMGIELAGGGYHWWEWLQVEQLWTGPVCTAIRAAGYIGITEVSEDELFDPKKYNTGPWLHRHNWLFAEVYAQVFVNGLVRVTARHVNNRFFDQGRDLEGFVPVIAFNASGAPLPDTSLDGRATDFLLGDEVAGVHLDIERGTDLISPEHPGRIRTDSGLATYQPYEGTECSRGDGEPAERWRVEVAERRLWKGMARSVAFDLSFAQTPIRTRRYLPPYGWLGHAGALWPDGLLPARGRLDGRCDDVLVLPPNAPHTGRKPLCSGRYFQGAALPDGEKAHGLMRQAYRTGRRDLYEWAIHTAYAFADLDYNARTLLWVSRRTGDPKYARAWIATYERRSRICTRKGARYESMYGNTKIPDNFPWHEAHLWGARWDGGKVTLDPMLALLEGGPGGRDRTAGRPFDTRQAHGRWSRSGRCVSHLQNPVLQKGSVRAGNERAERRCIPVPHATLARPRAGTARGYGAAPRDAGRFERTLVPGGIFTP